MADGNEYFIFEASLEKKNPRKYRGIRAVKRHKGLFLAIKPQKRERTQRSGDLFPGWWKSRVGNTGRSRLRVSEEEGCRGTEEPRGSRG